LIAAVVGAIAALVKAFQSTDKGATEFAARMEQIKAIIDVLRERLVLITDAIGKVFSGDWRGAAASMKEAFTGIGEQMKNATKAAYEYQYALDAIKDAENNYISQAAENRNKIARLEFTAQDRSKSTKERRAALVEALAIGAEEAKMAGEFAKQKLDAEVNYLAGKNNVRAEDIIGFIHMTDAEQANASESLKALRNNNEAKFAEIENLYAKMIDADTKYFEENKRNVSKLSGFDDEINKARLDAIKKAEDQRLADQKATFEAQKLAAKGNNAEMARILKAELDAELAATGITNAQKLLLQAQYNDALATMEAEAKKKKDDADKAAAELAKADIEAGFEAQRLKNERDLGMMKQILDAEYANMLTSVEYSKMTANQKLLIDEQYNAASRELSKARTDQIQEEAAVVADALGAMSDVVGKQTIVGKAFAVAQAVINTWKAASMALATYPPPFSYIAMAASVAAGLVTVRNILKVNPKGGNSGAGSAGAATTPPAPHNLATSITASNPNQQVAPAASSLVNSPNQSIIGAQPVGANRFTQTTAPQATGGEPAKPLTADDIATAVSKLPPPVVSVEDINARSNDARKVSVVANV